MKTPVGFSETRLKRLMKLAGLKTRKEAIECALREAERSAKVRSFLKSLLPDSEYADAIAPDYGVVALREEKTPYRA
jgi:Arc/MetJ family transcription regulator